MGRSVRRAWSAHALRWPANAPRWPALAPGLSALALLCGCASASPQVAKIALRGGDPKSEITLDGVPAGALSDYAHGRLLVKPGHHVISLRTPDGAVSVREADVGPGDDVALNVSGGTNK